MMEEDDLFLEKIRDRLKDHEEPLPVGGWERLQGALDANGTERKPHVVSMRRRWLLSAAAVAVVAIGLGLFFWNIADNPSMQTAAVQGQIAQSEPTNGGDHSDALGVAAAAEPTSEDTAVEDSEASISSGTSNTPSVAEAVTDEIPSTVEDVTSHEETVPSMHAESASSESANETTTAGEVSSEVSSSTAVRQRMQRSSSPMASPSASQPPAAGASFRQRGIDRITNPNISTVAIGGEAKSAAQRVGEALTRALPDAFGTSGEDLNDITSCISDVAQCLWEQSQSTDSSERTLCSTDEAWEAAGLAQLMNRLSTDAERSRFTTLYKDIALKIAAKQQPDGLWRAGLDDAGSADAETTALVCYALAWGVNHNILDRNAYRSPVLNAWRALNASPDFTGSAAEARSLAALEVGKL